jgi:hypothetical protein
MPFIAIGSSSSSSGEMVSSDYLTISYMHHKWRTVVLTRGFFLGLRFEDLRRPLTVITGADGVVTSPTDVAASTSSFSSDATIS